MNLTERFSWKIAAVVIVAAAALVVAFPLTSDINREGTPMTGEAIKSVEVGDYHDLFSLAPEESDLVIFVKNTKGMMEVEAPEDASSEVEEAYDMLEKITEVLDKENDVVVSRYQAESSYSSQYPGNTMEPPKEDKYLIVIKGDSSVKEEIVDILEEEGEPLEEETYDGVTIDRFGEMGIALVEDEYTVIGEEEPLKKFIDGHPFDYEPPEDLDSKVPEGRVVAFLNRKIGPEEEIEAGASISSGESTFVVENKEMPTPPGEDDYDLIDTLPKKMSSNIMGFNLNTKEDGDYVVVDYEGSLSGQSMAAAPVMGWYWMGGLASKPSGVSTAQTGYTVEQCDIAEDKISVKNTGTEPLPVTGTVYQDTQGIGEVQFNGLAPGNIEWVSVTGDLEEGKNYYISGADLPTVPFGC